LEAGRWRLDVGRWKMEDGRFVISFQSQPESQPLYLGRKLEDGS